MADPESPFARNIIGVQDLISNPTNKQMVSGGNSPEGLDGEKYDALNISMSDEELLKLRNEYERKYGPYESRLKPRVAKIKDSYLGKRPQGQWLVDTEVPIAANIQFEAEETFLAAALAKNPMPVVYADNTPEGNEIANAVKTMLQFHADQLVLRRKMAVMTRQWSIYLLGVLKPGWNPRVNDVTIDNRKIQDYVFDPDGHVDAYGDFSSWFGERITVSAEKLIEMFPQHKAYITEQCEGKLGSSVTYTEWWPSDDFCFYTFKDIVLDKHKNQFFNYPEPQTSLLDGTPVTDETGEPVMTTRRNHFAHPKKPAIFLSVFSLQEQPHDITSLTEQNISNQHKILRRTDQIDFNATSANNSYAFSEDNFNQETAKQAATARGKGNPILVPSGGPIGQALMPLSAQPLPAFIFQDLDQSKNDLRTSWGVQGITAEPQDEDQTARGMILNQAHDTSRIGGGIGEALAQVSDNTFNWLTQLYHVFYDQPHFAAILGTSKAIEYIQLSADSIDRQIIVSVAPDSMKPRDEITNLNLAQALYDKGAIGPKTLLKMVNFPDPEAAAADGVMYKIDPVAYFKINFPEAAARLEQLQAQAMPTAPGAAGIPPEAMTEPTSTTLGAPPASAALSNVPLPPVG